MSQHEPLPVNDEPAGPANPWLLPSLAVISVAWVFFGGEGLRTMLAPLLALYLGAYVSIVLHEAARSTAAWVSNHGVRRISIGTLGAAKAIEFKGIEIDVHAIPNVGITEIDPDEEDLVTEALILASGLVVHFGALAIAAAVARSVDAFYDTRMWLFGVLAGLLLQLAPRDIDGQPSAGRQLAAFVAHSADKALIAAGEAKTRRMASLAAVAARAAEEAARAVRERRRYEAAESLVLSSFPVSLTADPTALLEARAALEQMLEDETTETPAAIVKNDLARVLLALGEEPDMERAEEITAEVMGSGAEEPAVRATRGAALVGVGRYDEAFSLLSTAVSERTDGFSSAFLALAAIRLGRLDVARQAARDAYSSGVRVWALREAIPRIGRAEATMLVEGFGCGRKQPEEAAAAVIDAHGELAVAIGRAARSWLDHASPAETEVFHTEVGVEITTVRICADILARSGDQPAQTVEAASAAAF